MALKKTQHTIFQVSWMWYWSVSNGSKS